MEAQKVKLKDIKPNPNNPRVIKDAKFKQLVKSIQEFPEMLDIRPIVVNSEMVVLGGNMRLRAMQEAGFKDAKVIIAENLTEDQQKEFIVKDNVGFGEWDWEQLANEWDAEKLEEWGLDIPVFENKELEAEDDYEIPNEINTDIVIGDLFEIGEHRLLCGDSTDSDQVARLMNGEKADMVFTDPPYNVDYVGKTKEKLKIQNDKHNVSEFRKIISDAISNLILFTKRGGAYYICIPLEVGVTDLFLERTHLQSVLIWLKNTIVMGRKDYQQQTEPILFLINDTEEETYEGIVYGWNFGDSHDFYGGRKQSNVWKFDKPKRNGEHPTMKPIPLVGKAINNSSKEKDLTLDLFLGSGSTMVASHQLKRKCYGMELDPKYCQVIIDRMKKLDPTLEVKRNGQIYKP